MEKICVYTSVTGNYDNIKEIENKEKGIDYYLFTNNKNINSKTWNVIYIEDEELSNVLLARKNKILGNEIVNSYDIAVWIDGSVIFKKSIHDFIRTFLKKNYSFAAFKHFSRTNIKEECNFCLKYRKETKDNIKRILSFYEKENYAFDNGLIESTVYIKRPKDKKVIETMNIWFDIVKKYSKRDQLSFNYALSKTKLKVNWIDEVVWDNNWFTFKTHNSEGELKKARVYYGDDEVSFDMDLNEEIDYKIKNNEYSFKSKILSNTNIIRIEITNIPFYSYKNIKITGLKYDSFKIFNSINYDDIDIFYNNMGTIFLYGTFEKNTQYNFSVILEKITNEEKVYLLDYACQKVDECEHISKINQDLQKINADQNKIIDMLLNSFSWKITKPIRFITNILKRTK